MTPLVAESDTDVEASDQVLVVSTAGPSCVDNSAMNNVQPGDSGRSYVATQQFLHERSISCDDIVYLECTPRWSVALVADALKPQGYIVHKFYLQGHQNGDRYNRKRCGALALCGTMTLKMPLERYLEQTGFTLSDDFTPSDFFMATPAEQRQEFAEWNVLRGVTSSVDEPDWRLVLLPSQVQRLRLYEEKYASMVREGRLLKDDDDFVCDLDQNPGANRGRWFDSTSLSMSCMI